MSNEMNKMKRWSILSIFRCRDQLFTAGGQLQWDIQRWPNPPDPSTNHNFALEARHSGTAAWFFEGNTLAK